MTDLEVHVDVQHTSDQQTPAAQQEEDECWVEESDCPESPQRTPLREDTLLLLADVALLPPCDDEVPCSFDCGASSCEEIKHLERSLKPMQLQLQFLLSRADCLFNRLVDGPVNQSGKAPAEEVQCFLYTCQPYFNYVESTTRSTISLFRDLSFDVSSRHIQLLGFSQQLCDRLEQLLLNLASNSVVSLDEAEPGSISHFCIGLSRLCQLRVTAFYYCQLTPYLSQVDTGIYKRMRWNVERLREESGEREEETVCDTEYYFLCCEETPHLHSDAVSESPSASDSVVKMWSIGQWMQVNPDPDTEDIFDWIMCEVPQASYHRLLSLGSDEPSSFTATDHLHKLLRSHFDTGATQSTQHEEEESFS